MSVNTYTACVSAATLDSLKHHISPVVWKGPVVNHDSLEDCEFYEEIVLPQLIVQVLDYEERENATLKDIDRVRKQVLNDIIQSTIYEPHNCTEVEKLCAAPIAGKGGSRRHRRGGWSSFRGWRRWSLAPSFSPWLFSPYAPYNPFFWWR